MKATIILFSPSGNTSRVGELLKAGLVENNISTQLINIAGDEKYFLTNDKNKFLQEKVMNHDIIFIGSPVYAHHLQYNVIDLIKNLPRPMAGWGSIAIPFITYGGINSGIALGEAGSLLRKSGRRVLAGIKISSSHHMTKTFMEEEYNKNQPEEKTIYIIQNLIERIKKIDTNSLKDNSRHLKYQNLKTYIKATIIFKEKVWHQKRYPTIVVDDKKCIKCGKCIEVCPVCHLEQYYDKSVSKNFYNPCIHCFNCISECPQKSISPIGDLDKAKSFIENMIKKTKENPDTYLYPNL